MEDEVPGGSASRVFSRAAWNVLLMLHSRIGLPVPPQPKLVPVSVASQDPEGGSIVCEIEVALSIRLSQSPA